MLKKQPFPLNVQLMKHNIITGCTSRSLYYSMLLMCNWTYKAIIVGDHTCSWLHYTITTHYNNVIYHLHRMCQRYVPAHRIILVCDHPTLTLHIQQCNLSHLRQMFQLYGPGPRASFVPDCLSWSTLMCLQLPFLLSC